MNKQERKQHRQDQLKFNMSGTGLYLFQNNTSGDLQLPKATASGRRNVRKGEQFEGDNYFFSMVKSHDLRYIQDLSPKENNMEKKLILDQPPTITQEGTVEFVQPDTTKQKLNESDPGKQVQKPDLLLVEDPLSGVMLDD